MFAHDRLVRAVAHAGADHGALTCCAAQAQHGHGPCTHGRRTPSRNPFVRFQHGLRAPVRGAARALSRRCWRWRWRGRRCSSAASSAVVVLSFGLAPFLGQNFFPAVDAGQIKLHVRAPIGTRIEETARAVRPGRGGDPSASSRPTSWTASSTTSACRSAASTWPTATPAPIGVEDGDILITLDADHPPTADYVRTLRERAAAAISRHHLLLPAGRHRHADPQLRAAGADRRAGGRHQPRMANRRLRQRAARPHQPRPGHRRRRASSRRSTSRRSTSTSTARWPA